MCLKCIFIAKRFFLFFSYFFKQNKLMRWLFLTIFTGTCFSTHHRSSYRDAENTYRADSIIYEDISSSSSGSSSSDNVGSAENDQENIHKSVNSFHYRSRNNNNNNDEDNAEFSKDSRDNASETDLYDREHKERDIVRYVNFESIFGQKVNEN